MKYVVILGDGMADYPVEELGGKTPLQAAVKPKIDSLVPRSLCGMVKTIPEGMPPGSDTANLSVMGYDPAIYYTGRSPLEAVSIGIDMAPTDVSYRCNIVSLDGDGEYEDCRMWDYSCDEIPTEESEVLIRYLNDVFSTEAVQLYPGISYRHCLILKEAADGCITTPPHDISDRCVGTHLPTGQNAELLLSMMKRSRDLLKDHPINRARVARGVKPASSLWFWGEGRKPALTSYEKKYGVRGSVVSAVDLIKGIAICAGMNSIDVVGATGNIHTDFKAKALASIDALQRHSDFIYIHIEAPDECGHRREIENKVLAIEKIDQEIVGPMLDYLSSCKEPYRVLVLPDHPTPLYLRTHVPDPVPFVLYDSTVEQNSGILSYTEAQCQSTGVFVEPGHTLMDRFLGV